MRTLSSLEEIEALYAERGRATYGEGVTQLDHALQCATLAEAAGAAPSLIVAALLHDVGHMLEAEGDMSTDDRHEITGARALKPLFDETVRAPIALHVSAKRWLCFKEKDYFAKLSAASKETLKLQGGKFNATQAAGFERHPHWRAAVELRRLDEAGKTPGAEVRSFAHFEPMMRALMVRPPELVGAPRPA
jgi:phosphonate degradation associated HDIG domain protein